MDAKKCALYNGSVYKKIPEATETYVFCSSVKNFLLNIMGNMDIADQIASFMSPLTNLLSEPCCKLIRPIKLDYNFIEVSEGYFFNIDKKLFEKNPKTLNGSPRAYVFYNYDGNVPDPKPFIEGTN